MIYFNNFIEEVKKNLRRFLFRDSQFISYFNPVTIKFRPLYFLYVILTKLETFVPSDSNSYKPVLTCSILHFINKVLYSGLINWTPLSTTNINQSWYPIYFKNFRFQIQQDIWHIQTCLLTFLINNNSAYFVYIFLIWEYHVQPEDEHIPNPGTKTIPFFVWQYPSLRKFGDYTSTSDIVYNIGIDSTITSVIPQWNNLPGWIQFLPYIGDW